MNSLSDQLPSDKIVLILTIVTVDAQWACNPENIKGCDCILARTNPYSPTLVREPLIPTYTNYFTRFPYSSTEPSILNIPEAVVRAAEDTRQFNCEVQKKLGQSAMLKPNEMVTAEIAFEHHQLFGFPIIANPYTDPVVLHTSTTMRIIQDNRSQ